MATTAALSNSGAAPSGYSFVSTWNQNATLTDQKKDAILALCHAVSERPSAPNLGREQILNKEESRSVPPDESSLLDDAGAMDAQLGNTREFYKQYSELESATKSETEEYRLYEDTLTDRIRICDQILQQADIDMPFCGRLNYLPD